MPQYCITTPPGSFDPDKKSDWLPEFDQFSGTEFDDGWEMTFVIHSIQSFESAKAQLEKLGIEYSTFEMNVEESQDGEGWDVSI